MSSACGRYGELVFMKALQARQYAVVDVSADSNYWHRDIDFIATSPTTGAVKSFEVKWDSRINRTGNLYLELTNIHSQGGQGWFKFCEADFLAYGDSRAECFYVIPLADLRERVKQIPCRIASCGTDSTGLLVAIKDIADLISLL